MKQIVKKAWLTAFALGVLGISSAFPSVVKAQTACTSNVPSGFNYASITGRGGLFPEGGPINPSYITGTASANLPEISDSSQIAITFLGSNAGYSLRLGYFKYNSSNAIVAGSEILTSLRSTSAVGTSVTVPGTGFVAGENIGFFVEVNTGASTYRVYSLSNLNPDSVRHFAVASVPSSPGLVAFGVEDTLVGRGPDNDFNDIVFTVNVCGTINSCGIPDSVCSSLCSNDPDCECTVGTSQQEACGTDVGACNPGIRTRACGTDSRWQAWTACGGPDYVTPSPETCDGVDNNCNGIVDDGVVLDPSTCTSDGVGACQQSGPRICNGGAPVCTATNANPSTETCNGIDDDCDGQIDEGFVCSGGCDPALIGQSCSAGVGACSARGETICNGGSVVCAAIPGNPTTEICNGIDDNCDGSVDEGLVGESCSAGVGACLRTGVTSCNGTASVCDAVAGTPGVEICNGIDDNCDGQIDEGDVCRPVCNPDLAGRSCASVGVGVCASTGVTVCTADSSEPVCNAVVGTPTVETCNGLDDNCDGQIDEGDVCQPVCDPAQVGASCSTGVGACASTGVAVCSDGGIVCNARAGTPGVETCNGIDDDCNGQIDDGIICSSSEPVCGNHVTEAGEACDDGNLVNGDGCSSTCTLEPAVCGDGVLAPTEACEDGNLVDGDGCSSTCTIEQTNAEAPVATDPGISSINDQFQGSGDIGVGGCSLTSSQSSSQAFFPLVLLAMSAMWMLKKVRQKA